MGRAIKELVVCNTWDPEPLGLLKGLALGINRIKQIITAVVAKPWL